MMRSAGLWEAAGAAGNGQGRRGGWEEVADGGVGMGASASKLESRKNYYEVS